MNPRDPMRLDLEQAFREPGCAICRLGAKHVHHFLDGLLYESVNDPGVRRRVGRARGFCNRHAWEMRSLSGNALGMALLHRDALKEWQREIEAADRPDPSSKRGRYKDRIAHANAAHATCLACEAQAEIQQHLVDMLNRSLSDGEFADAFKSSAGLCRPHFAAACELALDRHTLTALQQAESEINQRLLAELDEFIRKQDYRFTSEGFGAEGDAWVRAIARMSGEARAR